MPDDRRPEDDGPTDSDEPGRSEAAQPSSGVEPDGERDGEPRTEEAAEISEERAHGSVVRRDSDPHERKQRDRVDYSRRMISSASSRVNARSVSVSSAP